MMAKSLKDQLFCHAIEIISWDFFARLLLLFTILNLSLSLISIIYSSYASRFKMFFMLN